MELLCLTNGYNKISIHSIRGFASSSLPHFKKQLINFSNKTSKNTPVWYGCPQAIKKLSTTFKEVK